MVNAFHRDQVPVFLISLKAGGTGLNLTAADIVIHYDPWWNVAAQNQATDRAHRIGQEKQVTVYKLIMKDTIEENILNLQEAKKNLADQIVTEGMVSLAGNEQGGIDKDFGDLNKQVRTPPVRPADGGGCVYESFVPVGRLSWRGNPAGMNCCGDRLHSLECAAVLSS